MRRFSSAIGVSPFVLVRPLGKRPISSLPTIATSHRILPSTTLYRKSSTSSSSSSATSSSSSHHAPTPRGFPPNFYILPPLTPKVQELMHGFHEMIPITVTWSEQDLFGHVNNANYIRWSESARIHWLMQLARAPIGGEEQSKLLPAVESFLSGKGTGPILKSIHMNFMAPVTYPDTIILGSRVHAIGSDRFSLIHRLVSSKYEAVVGETEGIIVTVEYKNGQGKKTDIPPLVRQAIQARIEQQRQSDLIKPMVKPPRVSLNYDPDMNMKKKKE